MYLGEIIVPTNDRDWVPKIRYRPEPPLVVRDSLDPYNQERKRALWIEEERAWKLIAPLQARYNELKREEARIMTLVQHWIRDIEILTGKKSGLSNAANYAALLYSLAGGPYAWAVAIGKLGVDLILSIGKKKQMKSIMSKLEALGREMTLVQEEMGQIVRKIEPLLAVRQVLIEKQAAQQATDMQRSETAYTTQQASQRAAGASAANRALLYERLHPARQVRDVSL